MRRTDRLPTLALAALAAFLFAVPVGAQETPARSITDVERELEATRERERRLAAEAETQIREIERLRTQIAAAALATQESEANLTAIEQRLAGLLAEEATKADELERRRGELSSLLVALQRLARHPPEALALLPERPIDTVRTARLLAAVVPPLEAEAISVARDVETLRELRDTVTAERAALAGAAQKLASDQQTLRALASRRGQLYQQTEAARRETAERGQALARQAEDLRELLRRLAENRVAEERASQRRTLEARVTEGLAGKLRRLGEARGQMAYPARGRVLLAFGQAGEGGQPHRGLSIEVRPDAQIIAPFDGQIVFAGPFRGYGRILIIEHGEGYHTLLAGLGRIDVAPGQVVVLGEPIATAGGSEASGPPETPGGTGATLYVELRRHGQPINPLPWLAASDRKVSG